MPPAATAPLQTQSKWNAASAAISGPGCKGGMGCQGKAGAIVVVAMGVVVDIVIFSFQWIRTVAVQCIHHSGLPERMISRFSLADRSGCALGYIHIVKRQTHTKKAAMPLCKSSSRRL